MGPWSRTMHDGLFPWFDFLTKPSHEAFGVRWNPNVDQEEWPCTQKVDVLIYFLPDICSKRAVVKRNKNPSLTILLSSSSLPQKGFHWNFIVTTLCAMGPCPFSTIPPLLPLSLQKPVGPCQWMMHAFKYIFWGSRTPWLLWPSFPWCKLKWSWDEFNIQSHILHGFGTTSWSMVEQPLRLLDRNCALNLGPVHIMDHKVGPWKMASSMVQFLSKKNNLQSLWVPH